MKPLAYSSIIAFMTHYQMLTEANTGQDVAIQLSSEEHETLAAMRKLIDELAPDERAALACDGLNAAPGPGSNESSRRYERAALKLRRLLLAKGVLQG